MCQIDLPEEERRRLLEEREEDLFATILVLTTAPTKVDKSNLDSSLMTSVPRRPLTLYLKIYWALISLRTNQHRQGIMHAVHCTRSRRRGQQQRRPRNIVEL